MKATAVPVAPRVLSSISLNLLGAGCRDLRSARALSHTREGGCEPVGPNKLPVEDTAVHWNVRDSAGGFSGG